MGSVIGELVKKIQRTGPKQVTQELLDDVVDVLESNGDSMAQAEQVINIIDARLNIAMGQLNGNCWACKHAVMSRLSPTSATLRTCEHMADRKILAANALKGCEFWAWDEGKTAGMLAGEIRVME